MHLRVKVAARGEPKTVAAENIDSTNNIQNLLKETNLHRN